MNIAEKAFQELNVEDARIKKVRYSSHFKNYNSNARYDFRSIIFNLSRQWKEVDEDIQQGLIESLIIRIFKIRNKKTQNMGLYESFMKGLSKYAKKHTHDPILEESFHRVNEKYFNGLIDKPNLVWASESLAKLGSYEYGSDTILISTIFQNLNESDIKFLDYVLYHELLHKKHSFNVKNGRHTSHTRAFREDEEKFGHDMEAELGKFLRRKKYSIRGLNKTRYSLKDWFKLW